MLGAPRRRVIPRYLDPESLSSPARPNRPGDFKLSPAAAPSGGGQGPTKAFSCRTSLEKIVPNTKKFVFSQRFRSFGDILKKKRFFEIFDQF
jgi:hypothetical protein